MRHHSCLAFISVEIETALAIGDTNALDGNLRLKLRTFLANEVVAILHREFNHARHRLVLVNIAQLRRSLQQFILALLLHRSAILLGQLCLELCLLLRESLFLLLLQR